MPRFFKNITSFSLSENPKELMLLRFANFTNSQLEEDDVCEVVKTVVAQGVTTFGFKTKKEGYAFLAKLGIQKADYPRYSKYSVHNHFVTPLVLGWHGKTPTGEDWVN